MHHHVTVMYDLITGNDSISNQRLQQLRKDQRENMTALWYPSAGIDFRDVLEFSSKSNSVAILPNIFIHSDYQLFSYNLSAGTVVRHYPEGAFIADSDNLPEGRPIAEVTIEACYDLSLTSIYSSCYNINHQYIEYPANTAANPIIKLLDLSLYKDGRKQDATVLYFGFENINFLNNILIQHRITIPYILKVREGCGFGGGRKSITIAFGLLSYLKTRFIISDDEGDCDYHLWQKINDQHGGTSKSYTLQKISNIKPLWSTLNVRIFQIKWEEQLLTTELLSKNLKVLRDIDWEAYRTISTL